MTAHHHEQQHLHRTQAFEALSSLVGEWRSAGRQTTTAGVTSALMVNGVLDLGVLGYDSNRDFFDAAVAAGIVRREQLPNGHWLILAPGEELADVRIERPRTAGRRPVPRLRSDAWAAFVEWDQDYRRFWDRASSRAFSVPTQPGWIPEVVGDRYAEIPAISYDTQVEWMKEFATQQLEPVSLTLLASLDQDAALGAFRRALEATGLVDGWKTQLRALVTQTAATWAEKNRVGLDDLLDHRTAPDNDARRPRRAAGDFSASPIRRTGQTAVSGASDLERLRARVHLVVDQMTREDLSGLPIRAEHLLNV